MAPSGIKAYPPLADRVLPYIDEKKERDRVNMFKECNHIIDTTNLEEAIKYTNDVVKFNPMQRIKDDYELEYKLEIENLLK